MGMVMDGWRAAQSMLGVFLMWHLLDGTNMKKTLLAGIAVLATISSANAADISARALDGGDWGIHIFGEIKPGDDMVFKREVAKIPLAKRPILVWLSSPGGDIVAGINIGEKIHAEHFATVVLEKCMSVCGLMWLAGTPRGVPEDARIGFHAAYYGSSGQVSSEANAWVGAYLNHLGFSYAAIRFLTEASPDSMQFLHSAEAERYGIKVLMLPPSSLENGKPVASPKKEPVASKYMCKNGTRWEEVPPYFEKCWDGSKPWDGSEPLSNRWWTFIPAVLAGLFTLGFIVRTR
jgi:hypothetical protein